ncbi:MAG: HD-GYP domain-containing protein [Myxococcota bacterium]
MADPVLQDLGFDVAGEILESVSASDAVFSVFDLSLKRIWSGRSSLDLIGQQLVRNQLENALASQGGVFDLGDRGQMVTAPITSAEGNPLAWLVALSSEESAGGLDVASREWKRTCETLPRVADMLSRECALAKELSGAVHELSDRYEELNTVFRMEREASQPGPQQDLVQSMLNGFLQHLGIDVGVLISPDAELPLRARGTRNAIPNVDLVITELTGKIWRFVAASKESLVMNEMDDERRGYLLTNLPFKLLAIPNAVCGEPNGGLVLLRAADQPDFTNSDLSLARVFFGQAMVLLRNQSLLKKMERFTRQIASSLVETVEAKDPYTRGHSERVEQITAKVGREAGVEEADFNDLLWGALLHDIGKIGVPDAILMKPGRLNADEYTFIKTHPNRSFEILRHVEQLGQAALDGARYHQEKFDGSGYPFGLAGQEIPLVARVIAIADTYDAVTSSRSYRAAKSHEEALAIIDSVSGAQLDPDLVDIFNRLVDEDEEWLDAIRPDNVMLENG